MNLNQFLRQDNESFVLKRAGIYHSVNNMHSHPELEVLYVYSGVGTLVLGECLFHVKGGELFVIGGGTPHMFRFEREIFYHPVLQKGKIEVPVDLLLLHLDPEIFGPLFLNAPENKLLNNFFKTAERVFLIENDFKDDILAGLEQLMDTPPNQRFIRLLTILNQLADMELQPILKTPVANDINIAEEPRLTKIFLTAMNDFKKRLTLKEVADSVYMSPNAFCNYVKEKTGQSFFDILLAMRVHYACKLLCEHDYSVVMICWDCGFTNLSNFNRQFKSITGKTPLEYRRNFRRKNEPLKEKNHVISPLIKIKAI